MNKIKHQEKHLDETKTSNLTDKESKVIVLEFPLLEIE